ncbi:MAG: sulfurtransferase TusA family protein [bacterium]
MKFIYKVPEELAEDIDQYRRDIERFKSGDIDPTAFRALRVPRGIYEQRVHGTFMMRIRLPAGGLTPAQMRKISELSLKFGSGIPHVTTRQDVQIHSVKLEDTPKVMEGLLEVGLTTKGGGGNTVRNITACYDAGVCPREAFDVSPYAVALTEYLIRDPASYKLPRKYKIAFSGCSLDCALATVNDLGFIAKTKKINGGEVRGFSVYVAGGMGAHSRVGDLLEDFVPDREVGYIAEAVKRLFDKHGNRRNKHRARLRFVMEKYRYERFKALYLEELGRLKEEERIELDLREIGEGRPDIAGPQMDYGAEDEGFQRWLKDSAVPQRQPGYFYVKIYLPLGDISAERLEKLSAIVDSFGEGIVRTTQDQNMVLRWVREDELKALYKALESIGLADGAREDVVCCAGASTCQLGICLSRGLAEAIVDELACRGEGQDGKDVKIRISGCPNACGQHPIGQIGLHGVARRSNGHLVPCYRVLLGGRVEEGLTALGRDFGVVPAKNVPSLLGDFLSAYAREKRADENFYAYLARRGEDLMRSLVEMYSPIPRYEEDGSYYRDWGSEEDFSLAGRGPGECGAGVFDMIEVDLDSARRSLEEAERIEREPPGEDPSRKLYEAVVHASRALLVTRGLEAKEDDKAIQLFEDEFIKRGLIGAEFVRILERASEFGKGSRESLSEDFPAIRKLVDSVRRLYESMDDSLRFHVEKEEAPVEGKADRFMDLRGVKCPLNYVKAKLALEEMEVGATLEILLDDGEPIRNVPSGLEGDGQIILKMERDGEHYRLLVRKNV